MFTHAALYIYADVHTHSIDWDARTRIDRCARARHTTINSKQQRKQKNQKTTIYSFCMRERTHLKFIAEQLFTKQKAWKKNARPKCRGTLYVPKSSWNLKCLLVNTLDAQTSHRLHSIGVAKIIGLPCFCFFIGGTGVEKNFLRCC